MANAQSPIQTHLAQMAKEAGGDHFHVHVGEDGSVKTHQVADGGKVQGPHDHKNLRDLKQSLVKFLDEEGAEK